MSNVTMSAKDTLSAKLAECFITIGTNRYNFMQMIKFEAKFKKKKTKVAILGQSGDGNKASGWEGNWSATAHYNQSIIRQMMLDYKNTGIDAYFEIQITNEDKGSDAGRQTLVFIGCNLDEGILAKFDASSELLDEDISGTYEDFKMPESFTLLNGML